MLGQQRTALNTYWELTDRTKPIEDLVWLVDWKAHDLPYCSLYVVTPDNNWPCKIGISVFPRKRVASLQTSVWRPLNVAHCVWALNSQEARRLEKKIHATLTEDNKWLHGEWFDMRPDDALEMINFCAAVEGVEISDKIEDAAALKTMNGMLKLTGTEAVLHSVEMTYRRIGLNEK